MINDNKRLSYVAVKLKKYQNCNFNVLFVCVLSPHSAHADVRTLNEIMSYLVVVLHDDEDDVYKKVMMDGCFFHNILYTFYMARTTSIHIMHTTQQQAENT